MQFSQLFAWVALATLAVAAPTGSPKAADFVRLSLSLKVSPLPGPSI